MQVFIYIFYEKSHEFPKMHRREYINIHTFNATKIKIIKNCKLVILIVKTVLELKIIYLIDDSIE